MASSINQVLLLAVMAAVVLLDSAKAVSEPDCAKGYERLGANMCVKRYDTKLTWPLARQRCQDDKADLLVLKGEKIISQFNKMDIATNGWIGLNKMNTGSNSYVWLDELDHPESDKVLDAHFSGQVNRDFEVTKCVFYNTITTGHDLKRWTNEGCVKRGAFFCAYNKYESYSPELTPFRYRSNVKCPDDSWTLSEGTCFKAISSDPRTFRESRIECFQHAGADLAEITSNAQMDAVKGLLKKGNKKGYWIGTCDVMVEAQFEYVSGRSMPHKKAFNLPWAKGAPNKTPKNSEDCVIIEASNKQWNDFDCKQDNDYVCSRQAIEINPCKPGYYPFGDDLCAKYNAEKVTYYGAKESSKKMGEELVVIKDEKTNKMFKTLTNNVNCFGWIGLNKIDSTPNFVWLDGTKTPVTFTDFLDDKKAQSNVKKCVKVTVDKNGKTGWDTAECAERQPYFTGYSKEEKENPTTTPSPPKENEKTKYDCPDDTWTRVDKTCVKAFSDENKSFNQAREYMANKYGGDLVEISTPNMFNVIKGIRKPGHRYWIGLSDAHKEGTMEYMSGKTMVKFNFHSWFKGEPNNAGNGEDCVEFHHQGYWNDMSCSSQRNWMGQVRASKACDCNIMKISPAVTIEGDNKEVTIKCDAKDLDDALKIVSITVFKTDKVSSSVTLLSGDNIVPKTGHPKGDKIQGHIDVKTPSKSTFSITFTKVTAEHSGNYRCIITYIGKDGFVKTKEITNTLKVEKCQLGYTLVGNDLCLKYHPKPETYTVARDICQGEGNDLVVMKDDVTNNAFKEHVKKTKQPGWIGINRINTYPKFVWLDSASELVTYRFDNYGSVLDKCAQVKINNNGNAGLVNTDCSKPQPFYSGYKKSEKYLPTKPTPEPKPQSTECPDNTWTLVDKTCVKAFSSQEPKTFMEARTFMASKYGGDLVEIVDKDMNKKVTDLLKESAFHFIGLTDEAKEGSFVTVSGKPMPPTNVFNPWSKHGLMGKDADCVEMDPHGKWNDVSCSKHKLNNWVGQIKPRELCTDCTKPTVTPTVLTEFDDTPVTFVCKASGLNADEIKWINIYRTDNVLAKITLIPDGRIATSKQLWAEDIETKGQIDNKNTENSYLSFTMPNPSVEMTGTYRCRIVYVKNKVTKQAETSNTCTVTPADADTLIKVVKNINVALKEKDNEIKKLKQFFYEEEKKTITVIDRKVTDLVKVVHNSKSSCCANLNSLLTSQGKAITSLVNAVTTVKCPKSWTYFNGLCYKEFQNLCNYQQALDHCRKHGGTLAQIYDKETNDFLLNGFKWEANNGHWMGMNDISKEGKFVWADGKEATYFNWRPTTYNTDGSDCSNFFPNIKGQWSMFNCKTTDQFLCQASPLTVKKD